MLIPIAILLFAGPAPCSTHEPKDASGALAAERRWVRAIEARDAAALGCLLDSGFTDINWRGQVLDRAAMLAGFAGKPRIRLALDDLSVKLCGDIVVVRGRNRQSDARGKSAGAVRFTDVFVYRAGAWHALSARETVIQPSAAP